MFFFYAANKKLQAPMQHLSVKSWIIIRNEQALLKFFCKWMPNFKMFKNIVPMDWIVTILIGAWWKAE